MKAGSVVSSGLVSRRTLKDKAGPTDPILIVQNRCWEVAGRLVVERGNVRKEREDKEFSLNVRFSHIYFFVGVAGI
jgi:hypothetical protein